jgi:hypothetical protein
MGEIILEIPPLLKLENAMISGYRKSGGDKPMEFITLNSKKIRV